MKLIIDSANIAKIKEYLTYLPIDGVTTNPSILKQEGEIDFVKHMKEIQTLIGPDRSFHIQTIQADYAGMMADAERIVEQFGKDVYIKIPTSKDGLRAMKELKEQGYRITATAIYSEIQALLAMELGADYLAPYFNRMQNLDTDPTAVIWNVAEQIAKTESPTRILAASFKNVNQVLEALHSGATHVTVGTDVLDAFVANANIAKAVDDFAGDWQAIHARREI